VLDFKQGEYSKTERRHVE